MAMSVPVRNFLRARRDRALGSILGVLEDDLKGKVTREEWEDIRGIVLDGVNGYHDAVLDLMKSEDDTSVRNDAIFELLTEISGQLSSPRRRASAPPPS
jgi:hypothetical protein